MSGYIKFYRKAELNPILHCDEFDRMHAWLWLIERANFKPVKIRIDGKIRVLERGQLWTSVRSLARTFGWGERRVRNFLNDLESAGMIKREGHTNGTTLTIEKYAFFQGEGHTNDTTLHTNDSTFGHTNDTTKPIEIPTSKPKAGHTNDSTLGHANGTQDNNKEIKKEKEADDFQSRYERAVAAFGARHPIGELKAGDPRYDESLIRDTGGEDLILLYPEGRKWQEQAMKEKSETRKRLEEKLNRLL